MKYATPAAFKMALERKALTKARASGIPAERVVLLFLFDRFLDRLLRELGNAQLTVKGGVALELRLERARTTRDLDLRVVGATEGIFERMRRTGRVVPKAVLEEKLYGIDSELESNAVPVHVHHLRRKLQDAVASAEIHTVRGVGYLLAETKG